MALSTSVIKRDTIMNKNKRSIFVAAISTFLLIAGAMLYAEVYIAPVVSPGAETVEGTIMNVGQGMIGRSDDGRNVFAHVGVIPIYVASIPQTLGDCTGNHTVDLNDFGVFQQCIVGPDDVPGAGCECADLDNDSDVDLRDAAIYALQFGVGS